MPMQARLKEVLHYHPESGIFVWLKSSCHRTIIGAIAGHITIYGYRKIYFERRYYPAHRLAWLYMTGYFPIDQIDHKNGIRDDNAWDNLREATRSINSQNQRRPMSTNQSGFLGVRIKRSHFYSEIYLLGKRHYLGVFDTPQEAHAAYIEAKRRLHPGCTL